MPVRTAVERQARACRLLLRLLLPSPPEAAVVLGEQSAAALEVWMTHDSQGSGVPGTCSRPPFSGMGLRWEMWLKGSRKEHGTARRAAPSPFSPQFQF